MEQKTLSMTFSSRLARILNTILIVLQNQLLYESREKDKKKKDFLASADNSEDDNDPFGDSDEDEGEDNERDYDPYKDGDEVNFLNIGNFPLVVSFLRGA